MSEYLENAPEIDSRYGRTKELLQVGIAHANPKDRLMGFKSRKENLIAQISEVLWVMGGSQEIKYLQPFLPRAIEFSDNPEDESPVWRSGYGKRIRSYPNDNGEPIDQLKSVIEILKKDLYSRRAFLVISYPPIDHTPGKDIACNTFISFLVRKDLEDDKDKLYMTVNCRSNDGFWGFSGINYFEFTFLQEFIANQLGIELGTYLHNVMSFHVYEHHFERLSKVRNEVLELREDKYCPPIKFESLEVFDKLFTIYKNYLNSLNQIGFKTFSNLKIIWEGFKKLLEISSKSESTVYFEIPMLYLLCKNSKEFRDYIFEYLNLNYFIKTDLFYTKINIIFKKLYS